MFTDITLKIHAKWPNTYCVFAGIILSRYFRMLPNMFGGENTGVITIGIQLLKDVTNFHFRLMTISRLSSPLRLIHSTFNDVHEHSLAGLFEPQYNFNQSYSIPFLQIIWIRSRSMIPLTSKRINTKVWNYEAAALPFLKLNIFPAIVSLWTLNVH